MSTTPYTFTHDDILVEFSRQTVRTTLEAERIQDKLLGALGYVAGNPAPASEAAFIAEYAECMSRSKTESPWWCHSNMPEDEIGRRYEVYMDESGALLLQYRRANTATQLPKKTS